MSINRLTFEQFVNYIYDHLPSYYREQDKLIGKPLYKFLSAFDDGAFKFVIEDATKILDIIDPEKTPSVVLPYLFKSYGLEIFNGIPEVYSRAMLAIIGMLWDYKGTTTVVRYLTSLIAGVKTTIEEDPNSLTITLDMDFESNSEAKLPSKENLVRIIDEFIPFYSIAVIVYLYHFGDAFTAFANDSNFVDNVTIKNEDIIFHNLSEDEFMKIKMALESENINLSASSSDSLTNKVYNQTNGTFFTNSAGSYDIISRKGELIKESVFTTEEE